MLSRRLQTTLHKKRSGAILSYYTGDNISQAKNLCHVVSEDPDNIAQEKILWNDVVILLGQHCIGQSPMQCISRGSRQHCIKKVRCNFVLILLKQYCTGQNPMQCCPRGSTKHCTGKIPVLILLGEHCSGQNSMHVVREDPDNIDQEKSCAMLLQDSWDNISQEIPYAMLHRGLETTFHRKKSRQCCSNNIWSLLLHKYIGSFTSKK